MTVREIVPIFIYLTDHVKAAFLPVQCQEVQGNISFQDRCTEIRKMNNNGIFVALDPIIYDTFTRLIIKGEHSLSTCLITESNKYRRPQNLRSEMTTSGSC